MLPYPTTVQDPAIAKSDLLDGQKPSDQDVLNALTPFWNEADINRKGGENPRDDKWRENLDLYWNRFDFSKKADWQAKEVLPEVPAFVDRFAAALKEALTAGKFYNVVDPADQEGDLAQSLEKMLDVWLTTVGRNQNGHPLDFPSVFEEQIKLGAIMNMATSVTWKNDVENGRVAHEAVDPRFIWLDHSYRNLYRIRRLEVDFKDLKELVGRLDAKGEPLYKLDNISALIGSFSPAEQNQQQELAGHGMMTTSQRTPITLDEYYADIIGTDGRPLEGGKRLTVIANGNYVVRGPEANPFWHKQDWLVYTPMIVTPLSVYGRSYMEDFGSVAKTFNELTNLILDAVHTVALKAFAMVPSALINPEQAVGGISPNKVFLLEDGYSAKEFAEGLELGNLPGEVMAVWEAMKQELREAAGLNEIGLGQFAPKGRTSATEVIQTQQSSNALIRSIASTIEHRFLDPVLDLTWKTGLQHCKPDDPVMRRAVGEDMFQALYGERKDLISQPMTFQARGLSTMIARAQMLNTTLQMLQVIAANELLLQSFLQKIDVGRLVARLFEWAGVNLGDFQKTEREKKIDALMQPILAQQQAAQGAAAAPQGPGDTEMAVAAQMMGFDVPQGQAQSK